MERDAAQLAQLSKDAERVAANLHYYHDLLGETELHCSKLSAWVSKQIAAGFAASDLSSEESELAEYRKSIDAIGNDFNLNWQELPTIHDAAKDLLPHYEPQDYPLLHLVRKESGNQTISVNGLVTELESISNNAHREAVKLLRPSKLIKELAAAAIDCRNAASNFVAHAQSKIEEIEHLQSRPTYYSESTIADSVSEFRRWVRWEVENRIEPAIVKLLDLTQGIGKPLDLIRKASTGRFIVGRNSATTSCEASLLWCEFIRDGDRKARAKVLGGNDLDYLTEAKRLIADANIPDIRSAIEAEEQNALNVIEPKESLPTTINTDELAEMLFERLAARLPASAAQDEEALSTDQVKTETANPPALKDGPLEPSSFVWKGKKAKLTATQFKIMDELWGAGRRGDGSYAIPFTDLKDAVWPDKGTTDENLYSHCTRITDALLAGGINATVFAENQYVMLTFHPEEISCSPCK